VSHLAPLNVPKAVLRFVREHIHSVSQLEVLLLLVTRPQPWSPAAVAAELRLTPRSAEIRLRDLQRRGLSRYVAVNDSYTYVPTSEAQHAVITDLVACYASMQHTIITEIFSARCLARRGSARGG